MLPLWLHSMLPVFLYIKLTLAQHGPTAWTTKPFNPFRLPLAVRNPYFNTWLAQGNNPRKLGNAWSTFWTETVSVTYSWLLNDYCFFELIFLSENGMVRRHCG